VKALFLRHENMQAAALARQHTLPASDWLAQPRREAECPICGEKGSRGTPAEVSLFFRVRCRIPKEQAIESRFCESCEHVFFSPPPTKEQLDRYYSGGYQNWFNMQERIAFEPGFSAHLEMLADPTSDHWKTRNSVYKEGLSEFKDFKGNVIDFGGDDGTLTQKIFPSTDNISVVDAGFTGNLSDLLRQCDFFFAAHVFEHLPKPYETLKDVAKNMKANSYFWIEVPQQYNGSLRDRWTEIEKGVPSPDPLAHMHEHIHHFSERSIETLLKRANINIEKRVLFPGSIMGLLGRKMDASQ